MNPTMSVFNCLRCGAAFFVDGGDMGDLGVVKTSGELCPICKAAPAPALTTQVYTAPPWALANAEPKVSAADALEDLLSEVRRDEANWTFDDRLDMSLKVDAERQRHPRKPKP